MTRKIEVPFAEEGDRIDIPDEVQPSGFVSFTEGYGFDYQRPIGSSPLAKNVERIKTNALYHNITAILQQFQQQGAPEWFIDTAYSLYARVKHEGNYYIALVDGTEEEPGAGDEWLLNNITPTYEEAVIELGGDFGSQEILCTRVGRMVTIAALDLLTHSSATSASSNTGAIPAQFRTTGIRRDNVSSIVSNVADVIQIDTDGTLIMSYIDTTVGTGIARTTSISAPSINYTTL